ncbi:hypothetical protein [Undibacterium crateris]|uniref:hypothetical protein n=1 Tax=Undibacterium crateris TaxID=2528175 RepID=UPI00138A3920|nr:hypothetical protein [Undibacterium crateris]NDI85099.1 hypothetical protein [Undibacterium crateris]
MRTFHIYMPISAAEQSTDAELESMFPGDAKEIRGQLDSMKKQGMEVIPSEGCDNQDATGRCLGHSNSKGGNP